MHLLIIIIQILAASGVHADGVNFCEYIQKNLKLYELNEDQKLSTKSAANFIRRELATALRKGPYQTNLLLAGADNDTVSLYFMDYLAAMVPVKYGAQGYAANFVLSVFDRYWKEGLSLEEGLDVIRKCIHELRVRFLISQPNFVIKVVDKSGTRIVSI